MYVCVCHAVTDRTIRQAAEQGVSSLDELSMHTGLGTCCGSCRELAVTILDDAHAAHVPRAA